MEINKKSTLRLFLIGKIFLIIIFFISSVIFLKVLTYDYYPDFSGYYYSPLKVFNGGNPYLGGKDFFTPFVYPPPVLLFFSPFTFLPFFIAQKVFLIISIFCLLLSTGLLFKLFKLAPFSILGLFFITLVLNYFPEKFTLGMGQINNVVLLMVTLFIYFYIKKKDYLSGIFLALAIAIKLFPILLIPYLIIKKKWKILFFSASAMIFIALFTYVFVDWKVNLFFYNNILPSFLSGLKSDYYNQALSGFLAREINNASTVNLVKNSTAIVLTLLSFILILIHRKHKALDLLCISTVLTLSLVINAFSWQHHFVFILIPLFVTFFYIKNNNLNLKYYLILGLSYMLMAFNMRNPSSFPIFFQSHVFYGTLILYILDMYFLFKFKKRADKIVT